jgi:hypothetical protein
VGIGRKGDQYYAGLASLSGEQTTDNTVSVPLTTTNFTAFVSVTFDVLYDSSDTIKIGNSNDSSMRYNTEIDWLSEFSVQIEFWQASTTNDHTILNLGSPYPSPYHHNDIKEGYYLLVRGDGQFYTNTFTDINDTNNTDAVGGRWLTMKIRHTPTTLYAYINDTLISTVDKPERVFAIAGLPTSVSNYVFVGSQYSTVYVRQFQITNRVDVPPAITTSTLQWTDQFPMYLHMDASRATTVSAGSTTLAAGGVVDQVSGTPFSYYGTTPVLHENRGIQMNGGHLYLDFGDYSTTIGPPATTGMNTTVMCVVQHLGNSSWQTMFNWSAPSNGPHLNIMRMGDSGSATYQEMTVNDFNRVSGKVATTKYNSNGDLETRIYVGTVEHNVNAADANSFDQTVTLRVYDDTGQNVFEGLPDSRTIAYSSIPVQCFASTSRTVHLGGYASGVHSPNLTMKELKWFQNKLSPEEEAAQVSAMAAKWGPPPPAAAIQSVSTNARVMYEAFRANSLSSGTLTDFSGNGYNFTGTNFTLDSSPPAFVGSTNTYYTVNINSSTGNWSHTVSYWIYISGSATISRQSDTLGSIYTVSTGGGGGARSYALYDNSQNVSFAFSGSRTITNITTYTRDVWEHMVFAYDGSTVRVYKNGTLVATNSTYTAALVDTNLALKLDAGVKLGNFILYDGALSAEEVMQNYNAGAQYYT